jgi:Methionyl-tRNA formyltransferase
MSAENIRNLVRALTKPYCGASFIYKKNEYIIWTAETIYCKFDNIEPGKVLMVNENQFTVKCGSNAIKILNVEPIIFDKIVVGDYL